MNYYNEIKKELIDNEVYKRIKDYSKNKYELERYYNVGKLLVEAQGGETRAKYGDSLIKEYSKKLVTEVGKKYNERTLRRIRQFYLLFKDQIWSAMPTKLTWSHYSELLPIRDINIINYYIDIAVKQNLTYRQLHEKIKFHEFERLSEDTKEKLKTKQAIALTDNIKHPIMIKNKYKSTDITERMLKNCILENLEDFLSELERALLLLKVSTRLN